MADRRRRRRRASQDSEDDDESGSNSDSGRSASPTAKSRVREPEPAEATAARPEVKSAVESECESEDGAGDAVLSDYDSADPEENGSHSEGVEEEEEAEHYGDEEAPAAAAAAAAAATTRESQPAVPGGSAPVEEEEGGEEGEVVEEEAEGEGPGKEENKGDEKGNLAGERQSGDGQESTDDPETKAGGKTGQQLDDDEDRKNPAYIPRKGLFFEHDVRGHAHEEERPKGRNRKLWKDEGRWEHDKFREEEQAPKSREELIAIYGYDIRKSGGGGEDRTYRQRRPRQNVSPNRDKRWREFIGGERGSRSWQGGGGGVNRAPAQHPPSTQPSSNLRNNHPSRPPPSRSRPPYQNQAPTPPPFHHRNEESHAPKMHPRDQGHKGQSEPVVDRGETIRGGRGGVERPSTKMVIENSTMVHVEEQDQSCSAVTSGGFQSSSPRRQRQEHRGSSDRSGSGSSSSTSDPSLQSLIAAEAAANRGGASPPAERPVERKSYALARRTRSRPADLGSKQPSVEETAGGGNTSSPSSTGERGWSGADPPSHTGAGLSDLDQDMVRLSLAGQSWSRSPTSYIRSEMRGIPNTMHMPCGPPPFPTVEEMGGAGSSRAKRYSSQRQRAVPEPTPPMHLGVMDGHYYEPMSYQGPIFAHGDAPAPIPPQGMLVQPEMHIAHPSLHPHQTGAPVTNPTLYGGPPVSLSPGQPQQLLPPPFYPPPGVMTFPYPAIYPPPQGQTQVTYGGVTYYDTVQQQAQPKPSPPRRTSQPVTVKPPPPEVPFASE